MERNLPASGDQAREVRYESLILSIVRDAATDAQQANEHLDRVCKAAVYAGIDSKDVAQAAYLPAGLF